MFLRCSVSGVLGFLYVFVALSCPARRQSSHYLPAEAPPCWCEVRPVAAGSALLLQSPPCCHGLRPVVESLCCGGLPQDGRLRQQWECTSVGAGCLGNGRLCQQLECSSVGADCLGNGGRPAPTELHHPGFSCAHSETLHPERLESPFCLSHCTGPNAVSLESSGLAHCPSPI